MSNGLAINNVRLIQGKAIKLCISTIYKQKIINLL